MLLLVSLKMPGLLSSLNSNATLNLIDKIRRKISGKGAVRAKRGFALFK